LQAHLTTKWYFDIKDEHILLVYGGHRWVTGHSYVVLRTTFKWRDGVDYEGAPNHPSRIVSGTFIERHRVNILLHGADGNSQLIKWGEQWPLKHNLTSLRLLVQRRSHKSRSVDVVSPDCRPRHLSDC